MTNVDLLRKATIGAVTVLMLSTSPVRAEGTEALGPPLITISSGTGTAVGGVGLFDGQPGTINVDVPVGATIAQAILYLEGTFAALGEVTPSMNVQVDGLDVTAIAIGGPTQIKNFVTVSYRADITGLGVVSDGPNSLDISGVDFTLENDGAGVLVIFDDGGQAAEIDLRDGNDYVFNELAGALAVSDPQTFTFPKSNSDRVANVDFFVGSVAGSSTGFDCRPNSFEITTSGGGGGSTAVFSDQLDSTDGSFWDTVSLAVTVPAGATRLTLEIFSRDDGFACPGNAPASMDWVAAGLSIETPGPDLCWITTGGFHNAGDQSGSKDFTFGGNVGPPPRGSWEVVDHNTGDNFHSNDVSIVSCEVINLTGPGQPGGKKGFKINQASFAGVGRLNHVDGFPFVGFVQDAGEPHGKKSNDQDFFSIVVRDPVTNLVVFETSATLDGGNVQIHPPTGN